jgi:hypothetical protein
MGSILKVETGHPLASFLGFSHGRRRRRRAELIAMSCVTKITPCLWLRRAADAA